MLSQAERSRNQALATLAQLGGRTTGEDDIKFEGKQVILPATMKDLDEAISFLRKRRDDEEQTYNFRRRFNYRPHDGAHATGAALKKVFGMTLGKAITIKGWFGEQVIPPDLIDIEVGFGQHVQVPWGAMGVPGLEKLTLYLGSEKDRDLGPLFVLHGEGPRKYRFHVEGLFQAIQHELETNSIYRGHAITGQTTPSFMDLSGVDPDAVVYTHTVLQQLEANVWSPMIHSRELEALGQPGKRAVLFEGPYGTGKTLAAYLTAKIAVEQGWTFFMVRPGRDNLREVMQTARMYQPAVVFFEDLDTVGSAESGGVEHLSEVLDLFDGMEAKGLKMLLVLTTNHVERLHPGMLRPGRLDAVISIGALDRPGVEKLARNVLGEALHPDVDFDEVFSANNGYMPAFVVEGFSRVARYAVARGEGRIEAKSIQTSDLVGAAEGLRAQFELMTGARDQKAAHTLDSAFAGVITDKVKSLVNGTLVVDEDGDPSAQLKVDETVNGF